MDIEPSQYRSARFVAAVISSTLQWLLLRLCKCAIGAKEVDLAANIHSTLTLLEAMADDAHHHLGDRSIDSRERTRRTLCAVGRRLIAEAGARLLHHALDGLAPIVLELLRAVCW